MASLARWILVPVASVAGWYAAIVAVGVLDWTYWLFDYPCPKEQLTSGSCPNVGFDWFDKYMSVLFAVGAGTAAALIVVGAALTAPKHKVATALAVYAVGAVIAAYMSTLLGEYLPLASALVVGAVTVVVLFRRYAQLQLPNTSFERTRGR